MNCTKQRHISVVWSPVTAQLVDGVGGGLVGKCRTKEQEVIGLKPTSTI